MSTEVIRNRVLRIAILTVSDTRTAETDKGGNRVQEIAKAAHFDVVARSLVKDDMEAISNIVEGWISDPSIDVIVTTGGTGIAKRDVTIEAVSSLLDKEIPGFGELFRYISYVDDIGLRAIASRAIAGVARNSLIFAIPGSVGAVTLAMERLIVPQIPHLVREITK